MTITDHEREGVLSFPQVLIKSSNVGTVLFAQRLSIAEFYETIKAFGFGTKTGIDLPAEELRPGLAGEEWNKKNSLPHVAIGYEVMVTPLQILQAMNVFATGGLLVRPRIVKDGAGRDGAGRDGPVRVISEKTATELVSRVFEAVVEEGTAKDGRLDGFRIAGKTGTAKKYDTAVERLHAEIHGLVRRLHARREAPPDHDRRPRRAQGRLLRRPGLRPGLPGHRPPGPPLSPRPAGAPAALPRPDRGDGEGRRP